jgi:hypothetical protein
MEMVKMEGAVGVRRIQTLLQAQEQQGHQGRAMTEALGQERPLAGAGAGGLGGLGLLDLQQLAAALEDRGSS